MEKYVYIKKSIAKHFVDFAEPLSPEEYNNLGETWQDYLNNLWVLLSDEQVAFHEENPNASVKEVWDMELTPPHVRTLEEAKMEKEMQIDEYDQSDNVNAFTINNEQKAWFTPDERSNYRNSIDAAKLVGIESLSMYVGNIAVTLSTQQAELMLAQIQLYADQCFMVTKGHKVNVEALTTIEEVDAYDYKAGYPQMLNFNIE